MTIRRRRHRDPMGAIGLVVMVLIIAFAVGLLWYSNHQADQKWDDCIAQGNIPERYGQYGGRVSCREPLPGER